MYFELFGNDNYYFQIINALEKKTNVYVENKTHQNILSLLFPEKRINFKINRNLKSIIKNLIYSNRFLLNSYLKLTSYRGIELPIKNPKYIFVIIHHKFIRYLSSIYSVLDDSIFILCDDIIESECLCIENNYNYLILKQNAIISKVNNNEYIDLLIFYETIKNYIERIKPKVIIVPEGNASIYELFNLVSANYSNIRTVCIQQGWSPVYHNGFRKMHYDVFCSWGDEFSELLCNYNPNQFFLSVGSHILEVDNTKNKKDSISFFHQGTNSIIEKKDSDKLLEFAKLIALKYQDTTVIIREHPSSAIDKIWKDDLLKISNIIFMNADKNLLSEVLSRTKIAVSIYSTVLFEAMIYDAVPFSFNTTSLVSLEPNLDKLQIGIKSNDISDGLKKIEYLLEQNGYDSILQNIRDYREKYFCCYGNNALNKIVKILKTEK